MNIASRKKYVGRVIRVRWLDASTHENQDLLENVEEGFLCDTYGLCVRSTKKGLTLATDKPHDMHEMRRFSWIPWGMVKIVKAYK